MKIKVKDFIEQNIDFVHEILTTYQTRFVCDDLKGEVLLSILITLYTDQSIDADFLESYNLTIFHVQVEGEQTVVYLKPNSPKL